MRVRSEHRFTLCPYPHPNPSEGIATRRPAKPMQAPALLCYCRPGFEPELAAELAERAGALGHAGYPQTERGSGFVRYSGMDEDAVTALDRALPFREGQLHYAANYYEAAGILAAMKAGVAPAALARPMQAIRIERTAAPAVATNGHAASGPANGHTTNGKRKKAAENGNGKAVNGAPTLVEVGGE